MRAQRDLRAAQYNANASPSLRDVVVYHAQQAAEKALKGYLTWRVQPFLKTHNLLLLVQQCETLDASFAQLHTAANVLTPYAAQFRYPGGPDEPIQSDADAARQLAQDVVQHVLSRLPAHVHP